MAKSQTNHKRSQITDTEAKRLPKISLFFFRRPLFTFVIWLVLVGFGISCYAVLMQRQGFPAVQAPLSLVNGTYLVNDPQKVDDQIGKPISEAALKQDDIKSIDTVANANTFSAIVNYKNGTDAKSASQKLQQAVQNDASLPKAATVQFLTINVSKYTTADGGSYDLLIAFYGSGKSTDELTAKAQKYVAALNSKNLSLVKNAKVVNPFTEGVNPATGQKQSIQTSFDRFGERVGGQTVFHNDVVIGVQAQVGADTVKLYKQVSSATAQLNVDSRFNGYKASVTASFGPAIQQEINELQKTLLEGFLAVLLVGTILIALRASLLIVLSMASVIAITIGLLYVIGYTLNVITLFALILGLALIVDDTIIMTEALDVERRRQNSPEHVVAAATRRVSLAMMAATSTAVLGFAPIIFVGGILGGFIRPIPITIISSLIISLLVALTFIPFAARFLILRKNNIGPKSKNPLPVRLQEKFAHQVLTAPLRWANHYRKRLWVLGITAIIVGTGFIFGGAYIFKYVTFNIFPATKDADQISMQMIFPAGTDINKAQNITDNANAIVSKTLGSNLKQINYYATANPHDAQGYIDLTHYTDRNITAPQLVDKLKANFKNFPANVTVQEQGPGGPPGQFNVLIETPDRGNAQALAANMAQFLRGQQLKRADGSVAHITQAIVANPDSWQRKNNKQLVEVSAQFDATDTSTLVTLAQNLVNKEYNQQQLSRYHLSKSNIAFDLGFESENQQSFKSMLLAFPILLAIMFLLLALEFRSLLQPLLIFMAIPFSFFGITGGLLLTNNPFSFFTLLGCFALIGLSIKNTILLTDYANQGRRAGLGRVDAISFALEERFRPLLATSATAVIALLPLAFTSPFWESLAFTLIFGLLSSTTLVLLVFPYYYLGAEYLRMRISRKGFFKWLLVNIVVIAIVAIVQKKLTLEAFAVLNLGWLIINRLKRR